MHEGKLALCDLRTVKGAARRPMASLRALGGAQRSGSRPVGNHGENLPSMLGSGVDQ